MCSSLPRIRRGHAREHFARVAAGTLALIAAGCAVTFGALAFWSGEMATLVVAFFFAGTSATILVLYRSHTGARRA